MEHACWKCGSPGHHSRDCKASVDVDSKLKREIQQHRRSVGLNKRFSVPIEDKLAKMSLIDLNELPPLKFINEEVGRRIDNLRDIDSQLQEVSEEITVDVDRIREDVQRLELVRTQLKNMSESLQELGWIIKKCKKTWPIDEEVEILYSRGEDIVEMKKALNNRNYVQLNNRKIALKVCDEFCENFASVNRWLSDVSSNGRPLEQEKTKYKELKQKIEHLLDKYSYLFSDNARVALEEKRNALNEDWKQATSCKRNLSELQKKLACLLCEENEKEWTLQCGHSFCNECLQNLKKPRTTEGIPVTDPYTLQTFVGQVHIRSGCPICRKPLEGAIKLFL